MIGEERKAQGNKIKVKATFLQMEGKLYSFEVEIIDDKGSAGKGTHTRAIVNNEKLLIGAAKRAS